MGKDNGPSTQGKPAQSGGAGGKVGCHASGCKAKEWKLEFCEEHFHQFKFGLITKEGKPCADYEKKQGYYLRWKAAQKIA